MTIKKQQYLFDIGLYNELGSNIGKYNYLNTNVLNRDNIANSEEFKRFFESQFSKYNLDRISLKEDYLYKHSAEIKNSEYSDNFFNLCDSTLFKGFSQGHSIIKNFVNSIGGPSALDEIIYFQANFANPLDVDNYSNSRKTFYKDLISFFFKCDISDSEYRKYTAKGRFLNADFIAAFKDSYNCLHILVIDNKLDLKFLLDHTKENGAMTALSYLSSIKARKVQFKNLNADTASFKADYDISSALMQYADTVNDKNILKVVQAGAYASSFLNFLDNIDLLDKFNDVYISIVGDVDTDVSIMNLSYKKDLSILNKMRDSYDCFSRDSKKSDKLPNIKKVCKKLSNDLEGNCVETNKIEFNKFLDLEKNSNSYICLKETLSTHTSTTANNPNMQKQNGDLFRVVMNDKNEVLCFLAGCPGIGKTFSFRECNKDLDSELSLYFSPRNAINEDFMQSYTSDLKNDLGENLLYDESRIILTASGTDGASENDEAIKVINYITNDDDNLPPKDRTNLSYRKIGNIYNFEDSKSEFKVDEANSTIKLKRGKKDGVMNRIVEGIKDCIYKSDNLKKITAVLTIQSQKKVFAGNTAQHLKNIFEEVVVSNIFGEKTINEQAFNKFAKLCPNIFIMIDEITGSPEGVELFLDIYDVFVTNFYDLLNEEQKKAINLKIIVADASLPNRDIMEKHLFKSDKIEQDKIYFSSIIDTPPKEAYTEYLDVVYKNKRIKGTVINANAYPAKELNLNYHIYNSSHHIDKDTSLSKEDADIRRAKINQDNLVNESIIKNAIDDIVVKKYPQTIIFIQDKNRIAKLVEELKNQWGNLDNSISDKDLVEDVNYLILDAELTDKDRAKHIATINSKINSTRVKSDGVNYDNELKFVFITSTASRGISFKICQSMHILLQNFGVESYLMELIQCIYRPRGDSINDADATKHLNFYQSQIIISNENFNDIYVDEDKNEDVSNFEYKKNQALLSIMSYISLLRGTINTRIKGYTTISGLNYSLVPVGGKYVNNSTSSLLEEMSNYMKLLEKEIKRINRNSELSDNARRSYIVCIIKIIELIRKCFNSMKVTACNTICKNGLGYESYYKYFIDCWNDKSLKSVINIDALHDYKFINGNFIFSAKNISDELYFMNTLRDVRKELYSYLSIINKMPGKSKNIEQSSMYIRELLKTELNRLENGSIGYFEYNNRNNRYIAIPASVFYDYENFTKYDYSNQYPSFDRNTGYIKDDEGIINVLNTIKSSIDSYSRTRDVLPIISDYTDSAPFITFKSDNLQSLHHNMFNKNYLICSTETNIFNLMMLSNLD